MYSCISEQSELTSQWSGTHVSQSLQNLQVSSAGDAGDACDAGDAGDTGDAGDAGEYTIASTSGVTSHRVLSDKNVGMLIAPVINQ